MAEAAAIASIARSASDTVGTGIQSWAIIKNNKYQKKQLGIQEKQFELQKKEADLNALEKIDQYGIEIEAAKGQIDSYDQWLNAGRHLEHGLQTKQLMSEGQQVYENFLNAIGYSDALAGATGRVGAGTSSSEVTKSIDQKLVDYFGEDRTVNNNGGLFGSQLSWQEYSQALEVEEATKQIDILGRSIEGYKTAIDRINENYFKEEEEKKRKKNVVDKVKSGVNELESWISNTWGDVKNSASNAWNKTTKFFKNLF